MYIRYIVVAVAVAFLVLAATLVTGVFRLSDSWSGRTAAAGPFDLCADFATYPDNTPFPDSFDLAGFRFEKAPSPHGWFVNESGGERGLQFPASGGRILLPVAVGRMNLRVGAYARDFDLVARDQNGADVATLTIPATNSWTDRQIVGQGMRTLAFQGGEYEGAIQKICIRIEAMEAAG